MPRSSIDARALFTALTVLTVSTVAGAQAAPTEACAEAERTIAQGVELRRQRRNDDALALFRRASEGCPSGRAFGQMAMAEHALARWTDAVEHYRRALEATGDPWVQRNRALLDEGLQVSASHVTPVAAPPIATGPVTPPRPTTSTSVAPLDPRSSPAGVAPPQRSRSALRTTAWVTAAGALGVGALGAALQAMHQGDVRDFNRACPPETDDPAVHARCTTPGARPATVATGAIVSASVAGALAITSVVLFIVSAPSRAESHRAARWGGGCGAARDGAGCTVAVVF